MASTAPTSRTRERPHGDEEASTELRLGEFQSVPTLTMSEARLLINAVIEHRKTQRKVEETETLIKMQDYLDIFARFKQKENIEAVERMLTTHTELEPFEKSQLGSLCCDSAEEAKTLIPSLGNRISDDELQDLLSEITNIREMDLHK
ncbi:MAG: hypothetical protein M1819_004960 [Sarea resinae]|nr:MAG: hypothetical protein M1819_004960 [Sarea resinae]